MKVIVFSDLHIGDHKKFARVDEQTGLNRRLIDGFDVLQNIFDYAVDEDIKHVFFCGDLFHDGSSLTPPMVLYTFEALQRFAIHGIPLFLLHGQHDLMTQYGGWTAIRPFPEMLDYDMTKDSSGVVLGHVEYDDFELLIAPYHRDFSKLREAFKGEHARSTKPVFFLGHFLIKEVLEKEGVPYADTVDCISVEELPKGCDFYFIGDYHKHVYLPEHKLMSVGCAQHISFNEANYGRPCFVVYDTETGKYELVETGAPAFWKVDYETFENNIPVGPDEERIRMKDYVKIEINDSVKMAIAKDEYSDWNIEYDLKLEESDQPDAKQRIDVEVASNPVDVIVRYGAHKKADEETQKLGIEIYKEGLI